MLMHNHTSVTSVKTTKTLKCIANSKSHTTIRLTSTTPPRQLQKTIQLIHTWEKGIDKKKNKKSFSLLNLKEHKTPSPARSTRNKQSST
jgi:hypothetical protein